jgi:CHAT domain-containing protein
LLTRELRVAAYQITRAAKAKPSPQAVADRAVLDLVEQRVRAAVGALEQASARFPTNAALCTDLAAAYLELARKPDHTLLLVRALALTDRALAIAPDLPEAIFNRALALERLHLTADARRAWQRSVEVENHSGWATEAAQHRNALDRPSYAAAWRQAKSALDAASLRGDHAALEQLIARFRQPARLYAEEELLGKWALSAGRHDPAASRLLAEITLIGEALRDQTGDEMLVTASAAIHQSSGTPAPAETRWQGVSAYQAYARALAEFHARNFQGSRALFSTAAGLLARARSPFSLWASFYMAVCDYQETAYDRAMDQLTVLLEQVSSHRYPVLQGRIYWLRGLITAIRGQLNSALAAYRQSAVLFTTVNESENLAAVENLIAQNLEFLGAEAESWRHRLIALAGVNKMIDPLRRLAVLQGLATASLNIHEPSIALVFQDEATLAAVEAGHPDLLSISLRRRALILERLSRLDLAAVALRQARATAARSRDAGIRRVLEIEVQVLNAETRLRSDPRQAVEAFGQILEDYRDTHFSRRRSEILFERALGYLALQNQDLAERDLQAAVALVEGEGEEVRDLGLRSQFLDHERALFDTLIQFYADRNFTAAALDASERSRANCLLSLRERTLLVAPKRQKGARTGPRAFSSAAIQHGLAPDVVLVEFSVLRDRILAWTVTRDHLSLTSTLCSEDHLAELVSRLDASAQHQLTPGEFDVVSTAAFDLLLRPALDRLTGLSKLILIPDKMLFAVPFAALRDSRSGRFLVEDYGVGQAPSATVYLAGLARLHHLTVSSQDSVLVIGPSPTGNRAVRFPELPAAREEAVVIASFYTKVKLLLDDRATATAIHTAAMQANVIHVAAHGEAETGFAPMLGISLTTAAGGSPTEAGDEALELPVTRLAFLSACDTGTGQISPSEGVLSPARSFLGAGVPVVVATLWKVEDRGARDLAIAFHRHYRLGPGVLESLRRAQVDLIRAHYPANAWAAFAAIGAAD